VILAKTTDEATAIRAGRKLLYQTEERIELGLPPKSKLFAAVIDDYVRFRQRDNAHGRTSAGMLRQTVRRFDEHGLILDCFYSKMPKIDKEGVEDQH
jgi:hypothetical protein